ncbi:phosphoribosylformylglycinamidine synthase [Clostridium omnivorum]|uniref:Phosphoribosylformylglycinamidine synthase n=1 Tax=Clostridium omnivorum TaxID=1604902 RepID=A0ABQ5N5T2_9CLOT|nr:phosphoribosylformylglycinamidine synthase [Clostridium sp. E14]GLC30597.1 phosphoribosylformylglycinamidine synthase [Clostridium sp. E14]
MSAIRRIFVEKKPGFDVEAKALLNDLKYNLGITELTDLRLLNRYDICGITQEEYENAKNIIFSEITVDYVYEEEIEFQQSRVFAMEYLPGQYDQRADSACQCIQILTQEEGVSINSAKVIILEGHINESQFEKIKSYCINPVDSRQASLDKPNSLDTSLENVHEIEILEGFIENSDEEMKKYIEKYGLAMSLEDLNFCKKYFKETEKRNPTMTELKVIDTYWSDHCRHTTFMTKIEAVDIEDGEYSEAISKAYGECLNSLEYVRNGEKKDICLMDIAIVGMKELRKRGQLSDLDSSDEINACSIEIDVDVDGNDEKWLLMFKNETHNHPTEIEPFGGAATCLGGAIRDPLSGRAYVYQAMRVTGSGDPRTKVEDTLPGKLPQRKITLGAAHGYSSYGNQIGLATGQVSEVYDEGFVAKRMEVGAVIAAAPKENVIRKTPMPGDLIVLIGGRTGRDGCGGATGSSKEHDEKSILTCGAEVQKGNPVVERKIQRLFRRPEVTKLIKRCNDFGAGGVSVAIGELTDGLDINLDLVPKKYEGLDGTELAISESQERMAIVIEKEHRDEIIGLSEEENLEATVVAEVKEDKRLRMFWRDKCIVNISREFLDTNGVRQNTKVVVKAPEKDSSYFKNKRVENVKDQWIDNLKKLNICSQKGLIERFDSSIGAGTVLMPLGGKYQITPAEGMAAKIPVLHGTTKTASLMTYGYNPEIAKWSPFHGAVYALVEAAAKIVSMAGDYKNIRLSLQEYFERLGKDPERWGKPFAALLGALHVQRQLGIPAIGGKDSMSGTFKELDVPPTLVAFAVTTAKVDRILSPEFKNTNSNVVMIEAPRDKNELPDFNILKNNFEKVQQLIKEGTVVSACSVKSGGIAEAISKMCFGNGIGFKMDEYFMAEDLFNPSYGSIILELKEDADLDKVFGEVVFTVLGTTQREAVIEIERTKISLSEAVTAYEDTLENIFKTRTEEINEPIENVSYGNRNTKAPVIKAAKPKIFIPVFPGSNCEYDSQLAFERAGGEASTLVFKNLSSRHIEESIDEMVKKINEAQIIMIPGGFSAGDEPDGSAKFIATIFRNEKIKDAVMKLLKQRDGLMLGICNGFQALIKLGLVPYGEITELSEDSPTLTYNKIGRHISCMARTRITSTLSPWFSNVNTGDIHTIPVSHGEGRFVASEAVVRKLIENGQIATQYVDFQGNATYDIAHNPNGSTFAIEAITSPDGRILGKMGHSERAYKDILRNIPGEKDQRLFEAGVNYFK